MKPWIMGRKLESIRLPLFEAVITEAFHPETRETLQAIRLEGKDACNAVVCNAGGEIVLVRQFRFGTQTLEWELPGGLIEDGETPQEAIVREVLEETGYHIKTSAYLGRVPANPVFQNQWIHHFWGEIDEKYLQAASPDSGEYLEMEWFSPEKVWEMIRNGDIRNPHTLSALLFLQLNHSAIENGFSVRTAVHNPAEK